MHRYYPRLDSLEQRWCPAATVTVKDFTTVVIRGDEAANVVVVSDQGNGNLNVTVDGGSATQFTNVKKVIFKGGAGDDDFTYDLLNPTTENLRVQCDGAAGNDKVTLNVNQPLDGFGNGRRFAVATGDGDDSVAATFAGAQDAKLLLAASLGAGADVLDVAVNGHVTGQSVAAFTISADAGADDLGFDATGMNVASQALVGFTVFTGADNDTLTYDHQGKVNGVLAVVISTGGGDDTATANCNVDENSEGTFGGSIVGGRGNDAVKFELVAPNSDILEIIALLDGGKGQDGGVATNNVTKFRIEGGLPVPPVE